MNDTSTNITTKTLDKAMILAGLMTVSQVCRAIPGARGNLSANPSTVTRWIIDGCPARNGERIKLKATRCGSRWLIDPIHLAEFFDALGCITPNATVPASRQQRTESQRQSAAARAAQELKRRGA
jgi:hypothetical protein